MLPCSCCETRVKFCNGSLTVMTIKFCNGFLTVMTMTLSCLKALFPHHTHCTASLFSKIEHHPSIVFCTCFLMIWVLPSKDNGCCASHHVLAPIEDIKHVLRSTMSYDLSSGVCCNKCFIALYVHVRLFPSIFFIGSGNTH